MFHRKRVWNECQGNGWVGSVSAANSRTESAASRQHEHHIYLWAGASLEPIPGVRFVITLDADTHLPRGAAARLVGTMAHPLNRPHYSAAEGRVVEGYGLVQPRITPSCRPTAKVRGFRRFFWAEWHRSRTPPLFPDVYQDLFREGSYTGKGIYDLDLLKRACRARSLENTLLSHDLFEGIFVRAALATDIELFDEFPSHYEAPQRGNIAGREATGNCFPGFLDRSVIRKKRRKPGFPRSAAGKCWTLSSSLSSPCMFLTLLLGWVLPHVSVSMWTRFVLAIIAIPALIPFLMGLDLRLGGISKRSHFRALLSDLTLGGWQIGLTLTFWPIRHG